jgi:hypothetical protein
MNVYYYWFSEWEEGIFIDWVCAKFGYLNSKEFAVLLMPFYCYREY